MKRRCLNEYEKENVMKRYHDGQPYSSSWIDDEVEACYEKMNDLFEIYDDILFSLKYYVDFGNDYNHVLSIYGECPVSSENEKELKKIFLDLVKEKYLESLLAV